jgi:ketol-acid reductoisomerase
VVHPENDPNGEGFEQAKAHAYWSHKVELNSLCCRSKIDLEQTILCGMLQTGSILCF